MTISQKKIARQKTEKSFSIVLFNSEMQRVAGATVIINNKKAVFNEVKSEYIIDTTAKGFILIEIVKEGYEPYKEKVFVKNNEDSKVVYLLKKGESYYYTDDVKVPYLENKRLILVSFQGKELETYLNTTHLKYKKYPDYLIGGKGYSDSSCRGPRNTLVIYKQDSSDFPMNNCTELKEIREIKGVHFAGPFIYYRGNPHPPFTYSNSFTVQISPDNSSQEVAEKAMYHKLLKCLSDLGIKEDEVKHHYENQYIITLSDKSVNQGIIQIMEHVRDCNVVEELNSDILLYTGID